MVEHNRQLVDTFQHRVHPRHMNQTSLVYAQLLMSKTTSHIILSSPSLSPLFVDPIVVPIIIPIFVDPIVVPIVVSIFVDPIVVPIVVSIFVDPIVVPIVVPIFVDLIVVPIVVPIFVDPIVVPIVVPIIVGFNHIEVPPISRLRIKILRTHPEVRL
jgi:hypothetical protein